MLLLGIDIGTSSIKVAIVDATTTSFKSMNKETETFIEIINKLNKMPLPRPRT